MDSDLDPMNREELIAEVKKLRKGIPSIGTLQGMTFVGITPLYGASFPRRRTLYHQYPSGRSSWKAAFGIGSRWISKHRELLEQTNSMKSEDFASENALCSRIPNKTDIVPNE